MGLYTTSSAYAKDTWLPAYNNMLENSAGTLLGWLGSMTRDVTRIEGRRAYIKMRIGDSLGQGTIPEAGDFPTPGDIESAEATLECAHIAHTLKFTDEEMVYLDSGTAAAAPIMQTKMTAAKEAMERDIQRQAWGDGNGIQANVASSSGQTITLDATTTDQVDRDRYIWLDDGYRQRYDIVNGTTGAQQVTGFVVTDINETTNVVTTNATMTAATAAGVLVRSGNWTSGGAFRSLEFDGIRALLSDSNTYLGINRATAGNGYFRATVLGNGGALRPLTENLAMTVMNRIARRSSGGKQPSGRDYAVFANSGTWSAYHNLLSPGLRYTLADTPDIGWTGALNFRGLPLYEDIHAPKNSLVGLKKSSIHFVKPKWEGNLDGSLMKFMERGGNIFFQGNAASGQGHSAQVFAYLNGFLGMYTDRPRDHFWLKDISEVAV